MFNVSVLAQLEPPFLGIHIFWSGPFSWIYSLKGWNIQRRIFSKRVELDCETITEQQIKNIRNSNERQLSFGWLSYRISSWGQVDPPFNIVDNKAQVFRLEFDEPQNFAKIKVAAKATFSFALYKNKVVSKVEATTSTAEINFFAVAIDAIVTYTIHPISLQYCISKSSPTSNDSWNTVPFLIKGLQLPLRELNPALQNFNDELQEAKSRLLPGEVIDSNEFSELMDMIRATVKPSTNHRHIDKILLLREELDAGFEELNATAPLLSLLAHPKWRRVLGFGWFDQDPTLQAGQTYEYRVTGFFPKEDLLDKIYGFHTIPSNTVLPASFFLDDLMLRFPQPSKVTLLPKTVNSGKIQLSRCAIELKIQNQFFWLLPSLGGWNLVIDFPNPVDKIRLEFVIGHQLKYEARSINGPVDGVQSMPPGAIVKLQFPLPIIQIRLNGTGFLYTIRTTSGLNGVNPISVESPPTKFVNYPRPSAPSSLQAENLQKSVGVAAPGGAVSNQATRSALGFELEWSPSLQNGLAFWPANEPAPPPLDSTLYQIEHRELPSNKWQPILAEENWVMGHRRSSQPSARIQQGMDLMEIFPESASSTGSTNQEMIWNDVFDFSVDGQLVSRPVPKLGTEHQYRIRAVDAIGRSSLNWKESNLVELQKLIPPPIPVGPFIGDDNSIDQLIPPGVHTRTLIKDAPDLTDEEKIILGNNDNIIILKWGWHDAQRALDLFASEFRVYLLNHSLDSIPGNLTNVSDLGNGQFEVDINLDNNIYENALKDTFLQIQEYPFYVISHEAGSGIKMKLERRIPDQNGQLSGPKLGPVSLPILIEPDRLRPPVWSNRFGVVPLTNASMYSFEIRNQLNLSSNQPNDEIWVGVSSADNQSYVNDALLPIEDRAGNESPIVPVRVQARFWGRPQFDVAPPLENIPEIRTREPAEGPIEVELDVSAFMDAGDLIGIQQIRLERTTSGIVFSNYYVSQDQRIMAKAIEPNQADVEINIANPLDRSNVVDALNQSNSSLMPNRYVIFLAASHPERAAFFAPVTPGPISIGAFIDTLPPASTRYAYRIRAGNAAGLISEGDAIVKVIVRVPSLKPGAQPERITPTVPLNPGTVQLRLPVDGDVGHILSFYEDVGTTNSDSRDEGALLRVDNSPNLYPDRIVKLRSPSGNIINATTKDLTDQDVIVDGDGDQIVLITINEAPGTEWRLWACSLTYDGIPSALSGPWRIAMARPPLPIPTLSSQVLNNKLILSWSWPQTPLRLPDTAVEYSEDGQLWKRISPLFPGVIVSHSINSPFSTGEYRLQLFNPDNRSALSNQITVN